MVHSQWSCAVDWKQGISIFPRVSPISRESGDLRECLATQKNVLPPGRMCCHPGGCVATALKICSFSGLHSSLYVRTVTFVRAWICADYTWASRLQAKGQQCWVYQTCSTSCIGYINYVYFIMSCLLWSYWSRCTLMGKYIRLLTCTSPLTAITFYQVSPNPMAIPKPILLHLKRSPQRTFSQKSIQNILLRNQRSSTLVMTFDSTFMGYTWPNERVLQATSGENCRSKG